MRSFRAVVQVTSNADVSVAGIPLLARTVLSLWTAGITRFTLIDDAPNPATSHTRALREITRVAPTARLTWITPGASDPNALAGSPVVIVRTSGVFHVNLLARLRAQSEQTNLFASAANTEEPVLQVFSAEAHRAFTNGRDITAAPCMVPDGEYFPAGTTAEIEKAERALFRWCTKETDGNVSRYLNRPVSNWISRRLSHYAVRPAQLTAVTGLSALAMFAALVSGTDTLIAIGCLLYHVTSVIDGLDGEIARAKYMSTPRGATMDTTVDMATNLLFILGISIGDQQVYDPMYGWIGVYIAVTALVAMMTLALTIHFGPGGGSFDVLQLTIRRRLRQSPRLTMVFGLINAFFKRDLFALAFALLGISGFAFAIPWVLAFGTTAWLVTILVNVPALLNSRREDVLPPHILHANGSATGDYASSG